MADPLVRTIAVVRMSDPALALSHSERVAYGRSRDPQAIRELPGQRAVRFIVRPLNHVDMGAVERATPGVEQIVRAFWLGCVEIQDCDEMGPRAGVRMVPSMRIPGRDLPAWADDEINAVQEALGRSALYEIGTVIYERTLRGKAAGGSVPYTVPQSSLDELASMAAHLRAEQTSAAPAAT